MIILADEFRWQPSEVVKMTTNRRQRLVAFIVERRYQERVKMEEARR